MAAEIHVVMTPNQAGKFVKKKQNEKVVRDQLV